MMKKKTEDAQLHPAQKFVIDRIKRTQIKNATYNPRQIDDHARKKLKENLKTIGLLEPIIWNKRTGNIVSGHQRMSILDDLSKVGDKYVLDVAVADLSDKDEKQQNVFMNNASAQGTYVDDALAKLIIEDGVDFKKAGFDEMDLQMRFDGTDHMETIFDLTDAPASVQRDMTELDKIQRLKRERKEHRERDKEANDPEFISVVVFPNREAQGEFMQRVGLSKDDRYVDGVRLHSSLEAVKPQTKTYNGEQFTAMTFWVSKDQQQVIEDELTRISTLLKGKNIRGRALEAIATISGQTPIENITGEEPEPVQKSKRKVS